MAHLILKQQSMANKMESLVNNMTAHNIRSTAKKLAKRDLMSAPYSFCGALIKCQSRSLHSTNIYASLASILNSEFPDIGLLLVKRIALNFIAAFDSKDKEKMRNASKLVAHLVNQTVVCETLAEDLLWLLLSDPTPGNLEVALELCMECRSHKLPVIFREREHAGAVCVFKPVITTRFRRYPCFKDGDKVTHEVSLLHGVRPEASLDELNQHGVGIHEAFSQMMIGRGGESDHEIQHKNPRNCRRMKLQFWN